MVTRKIKENVYAVGVVHWDRRLFDELIPLPDGTSYNAYLIKGSEKIALIDTVDPEKQEELIENLSALKVEKIDYIISNHAEQDHSGAIPFVLENFPEAKVVTNPKCKEMLKDHLLISEEKFLTVKDGASLSLGDKTLEFLVAPWVHWPETMFTYLKEDGILFSCDFLGSHFATSDLYAEDEAKVYESAKRYYAEIMMPFRNQIKKHLKRVESLQNLEIIAPSHGPIYKKVEFILEAYKDWVSDEVKNEVLVPYVSMHGSTEKMVQHFVGRLLEKGLSVKPFNLTKTDLGELAIALVDAATIVMAAPTVLVGPHPAAVYAAALVNALRPKTRFVSIIGSYGWGGKMVEYLKSMLGNLKVEIVEPVVVKGYPKEEDFKKLDKLAEEIFKKHENLN